MSGPRASRRASREADERFTVVGAAALAVVEYAASQGVATAGPVRRAALSLEALRDPEARVPQGVFNRLFDELSRADDAFGLRFAQRQSLDGFSLLGHLAARSATFGEALERIARYSRLVHDAGRVEVERRGDAVLVFPGCRGLLHAVPRHVAEHAAAAVVVQARALLGRPVPVKRVAFRHARPGSTAEHRRVFGVEPTFGARETVVALPAHALAWPMAGADPSLASLLERFAADAAARLDAEGDVVAKVEAHLARALEDGAPSLRATARALGLGERTLQRRLAELETGFDELLDSVRRTLAERYVRNPQLSLHEVAFLLGFADPSNFHRAFRRWFRETPAAFRARE